MLKKLLVLLTVAKDNGYKIEKELKECLNDELVLIKFKGCSIKCYCDEYQQTFSLNDLVFDFDEHYKNFIDALFKATQKMWDSFCNALFLTKEEELLKELCGKCLDKLDPEDFKHLWSKTSTNERLDFLLETFRHFL